MNSSVMLTVGLGSESTIVLGVIADGNIICQVTMNKQATEEHIGILQRHLDALYRMSSEVSAAIN